jgi:transketolase
MITRDNIIQSLIPYWTDKHYLLICDCGFAKVDRLQALYPKQVINMGIMEQGTVSIAAGMAKTGLIPIIYSIATFITQRALEQIRLDIVDNELNVKIIGNGCDDYFKDMGNCHWCKMTDVSLMNIINMPVYHSIRFNEWIESKKGGYIRV